MYGCTNCQQQLEFVNRMLVITAESEAPYLEQRFEVQEYRERDLRIVILVIVRVPWLLVVFEAHCCCGDAVRQNRAHHHHTKLRRPQDGMAQRRS